uniref:Pseudouridine synthase RsuA/RluA-like domain-containing protein n=1 Tax=Oryza rufipogon TaxID=4529 RepID=A0A0E0NFE5_ORYRU
MAAGPAGIVWQTPANPPERQDYIFRDGSSNPQPGLRRRYVRPYYFEFISHVKNRWAGKTIVDLFTDEFKGRPREYYVHAVKCGRLQVDDQMVHADYVVQSSQKISHFLHRHEPPVLGGDITILQNEADVVTVCKPASVPVHPCGQYRKNTVVAVHRLDRLVSGLLIFAKNADKAESFRQQIEASLLQKEYVAKVVGVFPDGEQTVNANVHFNAREGRSTAEVCDGDGKAPIGKQACTKFQRICTDGIHSIVLCKPVTGRTHQIRVHLKHIGYPIANDEVYLSENFSPRSSKGTRINRATTLACSLPSSDPDSCADLGNNDTNKDTEADEEFSIDPMCTNCPNLAPVGYDADEEALWLHCVRYTGPDWSYECPYPDWAFLDNVSRKKLKS